MTGSVEIPDEVVSRAADAYRDNLEYDAFGDVGDDQRFDATRAALVAARPYLMPTREDLASAWEEGWRRGVRDANRTGESTTENPYADPR